MTPVPEHISIDGYIDQILERFRNGNLPYAVLQVGTDSSQKIQQRWLPTIDDALAQGRDVSYLAFALAGWISFIRQALMNDHLDDPLRDAFDSCESSAIALDVQNFLVLVGSEKFAFFSDHLFMAAVYRFHETIAEMGVMQAVDTFLATNLGGDYA